MMMFISMVKDMTARLDEILIMGMLDARSIVKYDARKRPSLQRRAIARYARAILRLGRGLDIAVRVREAPLRQRRL